MKESKSKTDEISISRARLDSITVYDVTEDELEKIEQGSPSSLYLNFSIALLSIFITSIFSLLTTKIESDRIYILFVVVTILSLIAGMVFLVMWVRTYRNSRSVFKKIRGRKNVNAIKEEIKQELSSGIIVDEGREES